MVCQLPEVFPQTTGREDRTSIHRVWRLQERVQSSAFAENNYRRTHFCASFIVISVIIGILAGVYSSAAIIYLFGKKKNAALVTFWAGLVLYFPDCDELSSPPPHTVNVLVNLKNYSRLHISRVNPTASFDTLRNTTVDPVNLAARCFRQIVIHIFCDCHITGEITYMWPAAIYKKKSGVGLLSKMKETNNVTINFSRSKARKEERIVGQR